MALDREQIIQDTGGGSPQRSADRSAPITRCTNRSRAALAALLVLNACAGDKFEIGQAEDPDAADTGSDTAMDSGTIDAPDTDAAPADSGNDAKLDAPDDGPDAVALSCSKSGTVVFDPSMPCYKEGIFRAGKFLPPPDSSENTATCQTGTCANSPVNGDNEILWVPETSPTGIFTSVKKPQAFLAHCVTHTAATPPSLTDLAADYALPSGWFTPNVSTVGPQYTVTSFACTGADAGGKSLMIVAQYGP